MPASLLRYLAAAVGIAAAACAMQTMRSVSGTRSGGAEQRQVYTRRAERLFQTLVPQGGALQLTAREAYVGGRRSWDVDCADESGVYLARATWDSGTGCLLGVSTVSTVAHRFQRPLDRHEALDCASGWARTLGIVDRQTRLYAVRPLEQGRDTWHVDLIGGGQSVHVLLDRWTAYPLRVMCRRPRGAAAGPA